ncbi:hypothetical protein D6D15_08474 [Aureobasidium pullulans]|uniref:Uncharacterized protein n=1 Tax=Aureobasidium pullulans TaxID=5580 RepID=A0A4S9AXH6_AURPU|nr:hypothetical protein D6D15_08474 [Aureobasidium pullulans]
MQGMYCSICYRDTSYRHAPLHLQPDILLAHTAHAGLLNAPKHPPLLRLYLYGGIRRPLPVARVCGEDMTKRVDMDLMAVPVLILSWAFFLLTLPIYMVRWFMMRLVPEGR